MPKFHLFFESMEKYLIGSVSKFQKFLEILSNENNMHRFCCFTGCLPKNVGSKIFLTNNILSTCICLTSLTRAKCGVRSTLCWKIPNISGSIELFAL